jgi:hypothetical protein
MAVDNETLEKLMLAMMLIPGFVREWSQINDCGHLNDKDLMLEFERQYRDQNGLPELSTEERLDRSTL